MELLARQEYDMAMDRALIIAAAMVAASAAFAEEPVSPDTSAIILAPKTAAAPVSQPRAARAQSPSAGVAADIATSLPKFKQESAATPLAQQPDMRDVDKPRNKIPRLPVNVMQKYVVRGDRVPVFRERDLYTKEGLIDIGFKQHPGLMIGNLFGLNKAAAYEAFLEDNKIAWKAEMDDTALAMAAGGDFDEAKTILSFTGDSVYRDMDTSGPVPMGSGPNER
ncbi:MAG TPA: hypothetical protein VFE25_03760 [Opitutaceae bacterium]|nr:hypothetical protein [Opitutaceae bacterium]